MWVEDPTNQCNDFDRNFLRNQIVPLLKTRWSSVAKTVSRSANHCANAQQLLDELAEKLFAEVVDDKNDCAMTGSPLKDCQSYSNTLSISKLLKLDVNKQSLVIRQWFKNQILQMPSTAFIEAIFNEVIHTKSSAMPQLSKNGIVIRRYQDKLYCGKDLPCFKNLEGLTLSWEQTENKIQLPDNSILQRFPATSGIPVSLWQAAKVTVRFRQGGEKIRLTGRKGQQSLKNLFQETAIPPWERDFIPLLYFDETLIAVADLWLSSHVQTEQHGLYYKLKWQKAS
jgi:tRNA(Ile)-lysidine synthase